MLTSWSAIECLLLFGSCFMYVPMSMSLLAFGCNCSLIGLIISKVLNSPKRVVNTMETIAQTFLANLICHLPSINNVNNICLSTCRAADWACLRRTANYVSCQSNLPKINVICHFDLPKIALICQKIHLICQSGISFAIFDLFCHRCFAYLPCGVIAYE